MENFVRLLRPAYPRLKRNDCLPLSDTGYRVTFGKPSVSPFTLEVAFNPSKMIVRKLFLRGDFQGSGMGRMIVELLKQECRAIGLDGIELDTVLPESIGFWQKCGFEIHGYSGYWSCDNE